LMTQNLNGTLG